jgi:hypothetical protein
VLRKFYQQALSMPRQAGVIKAALSSPDKASAREVDALAAVGSVLFNLDAALER